jgi:DNA-directed RNA polymerase subunit beta
LEIEPDKVDYMDISPKQLVSVAAALIPFLEHDDANRALMGSNMQRQGVPLLVSEAPIVGTGMEGKVARDSKAVVLSEASGKVAEVTADRIIVTKDGEMPNQKKVKHDPGNDVGIYDLRKFMRSNAGTCINQRPIVKKGQHVKKGQVIADGPNTEDGELALGRNVLVAFMPWNGYNFEDAIVISKRVSKEDIYTSIHIEEFEIGARDTKLGPEEITRDIPNVSEEALRNLGPDGVIRVGAEVKPGDILVGKITPKSETELAPEERLLRAIFGEKAADVKDTSLTVPSGTYGIVMDVKVSSRLKEVQRLKLSPVEAKKQGKAIEEEFIKRKDELHEQLTEALSNILLGEKIPLDVVNAQTGEIIIPANRKITKTLLRKLASVYDHVDIDPSPIRNKIREIIGQFEHKFAELELERERRMDSVEAGDEVDPGIIKQVKVYVASKRKLSVGDKMAGRHGNKGVVAKIVPEEDMPFLNNGQPVDIVLNPLGVPSRMNVGQVLETHLGVAARALGFKVATPVFDGIKEDEIFSFVQKARKVPGYEWLGETGKSIVYDGRSGEQFDQTIVVGVIYMLKLGHLVADKIHARAVGPYSLVTQQPLGGKAQYGGQRFGEMEVWALEAYGAAYTLQELLTVKSDDVQGRTRIYEAIVKGDNSLEAGTPESFNVLIKEMQSLGLDVKVGSKTNIASLAADLGL